MKRQRTVKPVSRQADSSQLEGATESSAPNTPLFQHSLESIAVHTPSQMLEAGLRSSMERSFGASFADVRVAELPSVGDLGARALTHGSNLYFQSGAFHPDSVAGRELIGHELAHVVQQRGGSNSKGRGLSFNSTLESEADGAGAAAARGMSVNVSAGSANGLGVQAKFGSGMLEKFKNFFGFGSKKSDAAPELSQNEASELPEAPELAPQGEQLPANPILYNKTAPLAPQFKNEQVDFSEDPGTRTRYLSDSERPHHRINFGGGLAQQDGETLDTTAAARSSNNRGKTGRNLFTMSPEGDFHAADGRAEMEKLVENNERFHHSSLAQGKDVAGAGEIAVRNGQVTAISDQSGHYQPKAELTYQVVQELNRQKALHDESLDAAGKPLNRAARVELQAKPKNANLYSHALWRDEVSLSSDQFLQTGGNERQIRQKIALNKQLGGLQSADELENTPPQVLARAQISNRNNFVHPRSKPQWLQDLEQGKQQRAAQGAQPSVVADGQAVEDNRRLYSMSGDAAYDQSPSSHLYSMGGGGDPSYDKMPDVPAYDKMAADPLYDKMPDVPAYDKMPDVPPYDKMP